MFKPYWRIIINLRIVVYIALITLLIDFSSCITEPNNETASIEIRFDSTSFNSKVYLEKLSPNSTNIVDSIKPINSEYIIFNFTPEQSSDIYILRFNPDQAITLIVDSNSHIVVKINGIPYNSNYTVSGSKSSDILRSNNGIINKHIDIFETKYTEYRGRKRDKNFKKYRIETDSILRQNQIELYTELKESISQNTNSLASLLAIYSKFGSQNIFDITLDINLYQKLSDSLMANYPNNSHAKFFYNRVQKELNDIRLKEIRELKLDKGNVFPDITLNNLDNSAFNIKKVKAKYIIVYLWKAKYKAFWDDNVFLRDIYKKYDRNKLEIIGISFEKDKLSWANYCRMERMNWINLISGPENTEVINPNNIYPRIFLLDKHFKILIKDTVVLQQVE